MGYSPINWLNKGETGAKPINKENLNHMEEGINTRAEIIKLLTVSNVAPSNPTFGDRYYNTVDEKLYVAMIHSVESPTITWDEEALSTKYLYVDLANKNLYYYDGTNFNSYGGGSAVGDTLPIGSMLPYGNVNAPSGWLICDGSEISRTTYAELFAVIGTSYGEGDGSTTFNLPNKKGRVSAGYDSSNSNFNAIGKHLGEETHTLTVEEIPSHNHNYYAIGEANSLSHNTMVTVGEASGNNLQKNVDSTGGSQAHNNIQPTEVDNWIIKSFQSSGVVANVAKVKTTSDTDTYSCDYINGKKIAISSATTLEAGSIDLENEYEYVDFICATNTSDSTSRTITRIYQGYTMVVDGLVYAEGLMWIANRNVTLSGKTLSWGDCIANGIQGNTQTSSTFTQCIKPMEVYCYNKKS